MSAYPRLFSPCSLGPLTLKNRITMAPLFLGYGKPTGEVSPLLLDHYREMAASGAALNEVENAAIDPGGLGSPFTLRLDQDRFLPGLKDLASTIKGQGALAALQINHAGRFAWSSEPLAPSAVATTGKVTPRALTTEEIRELIRKFAAAALRAQAAGFDLVELHGGTGYLLSQFLSPRTNRREDAYGGSLENRLRFPLEVIRAVREALGPEFPVGYRFLADEWLPDGLQLAEAREVARRLAETGLVYLSVMGGTYESFFLPERKEQERHQGYMSDLAAAVKSAVSLPVITAGRIQEPGFAEALLVAGKADLIGLARVLLADPLWPIKAGEGRAAEIVSCEPVCSLCFQRVMKGQPVICSQWPKEKRERFGEG
ncbi:MAG: NADH:flavin oxidoreductase [Desulfobacterota bacterium]|nr:NADH:flavin oxidoreductase [Thermodesulfobacteriota bacterium]